jgi:hypothetical protein
LKFVFQDLCLKACKPTKRYQSENFSSWGGSVFEIIALEFLDEWVSKKSDGLKQLDFHSSLNFAKPVLFSVRDQLGGLL